MRFERRIVRAPRTVLVLGVASLSACSLLVPVSDLSRGAPVTEEDGAAGPPDVATDAPPSGDGGGRDAEDPFAEWLVGRWTFDQDGGTTVDDLTANSNNAILVGASTFPTFTAGLYGNAISFGDSPQYFEVKPLAGAKFPRQGTLSFWLKSAFSGNFAPIFDGQGATRRHLSIRNHREGGIQFGGSRGSDSGPDFAFDSFFQVPRDEWTHLVFVWAFPDGQVKAYRDGAEVATVDATPGWDPDAQEFTFAKRPGGVGYVGLLDELRLYDRAFTVDDVERIP